MGSAVHPGCLRNPDPIYNRKSATHSRHRFGSALCNQTLLQNRLPLTKTADQQQIDDPWFRPLLGCSAFGIHITTACTLRIASLLQLRNPMHRMISKNYAKVLDFWFGPKGSPSYLQPKSFWYGSPSDDAHVRKHLGQDYEAAKSGSLDLWREEGEGEGALALIILLDQVPRNIFRDTPQAYATDSQALTVARYAVDRGWDKKFPTVQRRYMYSPFNHSEDLKDQEVSVRLFTELGDSYHLRWAKDFYEQIKKNGRFVHRDRVLGR